MHSVLSGGPALWREHELLFINSRGFAQETFHTFSQSPVPDDDGKVGGVLLTVQETTEQVQGERQLRDAARARGTNRRREDRDGGLRPRRLGPRRRRRGRSLLPRVPPRGRRHADARRLEPGVPRGAHRPARSRRAGGRSTRRCAPVSPSPSTTSRAASVPCLAAATASGPSGPSSSRCSETKEIGTASSSSASPRGAPLPRDTSASSRSSPRSSPRRSRAPGPRRRSDAAPRPWPSSTAPRPCSSATSATSSARR